MNNTFTQDDLILYFYGEMSTARSEQLRQELNVNSELKAQLIELQSIADELDKVSLTPSDKVIERILIEANVQLMQDHR